MFSATLRQRLGVETLVVHLQYSRDPVFKERPLQTHDLAIPVHQSSASSLNSATRPTQQPLAPPPRPPSHHLFLILTPIDLTSTNEPATLDRITRFSTLTASPPPTIALILHPDLAKDPDSAMPATTNSGATEKGLQAYARLQILIHAPPTITTISKPPNKNIPPTPIPILPIPSPSLLLPLLRTYAAPPIPQPSPPSSFKPALQRLLPHVTATGAEHPLNQHTINVLSDLCHSIREVAWICEREEGRKMLREWIGEEGEEAVVGFWGGEWVAGE